MEKVQKLHQTILTVRGQFGAFLFHKFNLYRDKSSPIQQIRPCSKRFNILVFEVYKYFNKNRTKIEKLENFFFDVNSGQFWFQKLHLSSLSIRDNTFFPCRLFSTFHLTKCQKIGKKCMKALKIGKLWVFCHFRCQFETFSFKTLQLSLH